MVNNKYIFILGGVVIPVFIGVPRAWPLEEGVGPLGGEAWLVLSPQHPVGQRELDLGVWNCFTAGGTCWRGSPPPSWSGSSGPGRGAGRPCHGSTA